MQAAVTRTKPHSEEDDNGRQKRAYEEDLASRRGRQRGETKDRYSRFAKIVSGKCLGATYTLIVDKKGRLLITEAEQGARWAEHFSKVLNRPQPTIRAEAQDLDTDLDISTAPPEKEEITAAIRSLKN